MNIYKKWKTERLRSFWLDIDLEFLTDNGLIGRIMRGEI